VASPMLSGPAAHAVGVGGGASFPAVVALLAGVGAGAPVVAVQRWALEPRAYRGHPPAPLRGGRGGGQQRVVCSRSRGFVCPGG
jgi:hypothetical protein